MNSIAPTSATKTFSRGCLIYLAVGITTFMIVFMTAAVITYLMPKKFVSNAIIQVRPFTQMGQSITPQFFVTESEVIKSNLTLKPVVQKLELLEKWMTPEDQAISILQSTLRLQHIRGTDLIEINVLHQDPEQARDIAMEVYRSYKLRREEKAQEEIKNFHAEMEKAVLDQHDLVAEKRKLRDHTLRRAPYHPGDSSIATPPLDGKVLQIQREAQIEFETQQALLERMREKLAMERMNSKLVSLVELHEEPLVAQFPSSPNVNLNLIMGATLGLIFGCGMALFVRLVFGRKISG
ncbi:MAG: hypothetical protein RI957_1253 [Verrucomicrobiota bacterium]|jgi:uncharacterized protein involved in exopolysaccharide biosynthesis